MRALSTPTTILERSPHPPAAAVGTARLAALDQARLLLAALVVAHHAGQPYGPTGGDWPLFESARAAILGPFFAVNAAFFMGLFFFISGYLLPGSYDRKGPAAFLRDRALRLGVPLAVFAFGIFPVLLYGLGGRPDSFWQFYIGDYLGQWRIETGHLWFLAHLLVYALAFTAWRQFAGSGRATVASRFVPGHGTLLLGTLALAGLTFAARLWFPIDHWVRLADLVRVEIAHLPQYLSLFVLGIVAYRRDWLRRLPTATGLAWLGIGLVAAQVVYGLALLRPAGQPGLFAGGGATTGSLLWSLVEALICVGLSVGLLTFLRQLPAWHTRLLGLAAANTYGAYVVHVPLIVGLQFALVGVDLPPLAKFGLVTLVGIPLAFGVSALIRLWPLARRVL